MSIKQFIKHWCIPAGIWNAMAETKSAMHAQVSKQNTKEMELLTQTCGIKNRHEGTRCFILGAGSSIREQDISKLVGEYIISVSNTFVHPDFQKIKPRYHALPPLLKSHGSLYEEEEFVKWLRQMEVATDDAEMIMHIGDRQKIECNGLFEGRTINWVNYRNIPWDERFDTPIDLSNLPDIWSVSELALTVAVYMGFDQIYLVGFDHDWFNGPLVYFYDHKTQHAMKPTEEKLAFADSELQMRRHAYIFKKYKYLYSIKGNIYNANANSRHYLDVFPKVDYDSLF